MANGWFRKRSIKNQIITIDSSLSVKETVKKMDEEEIGCVVITEKNYLVGILTERDFVRKILDCEKPSSTPIKEIMSFPLVVIDSYSAI
jgi:CBS domain-containing protein